VETSQGTLEARRSRIEESRRIRGAEDKARRNWETWQQASAEAEHWQRATERAGHERKAWQEARDEALALRQAREQAIRQRCMTAAVSDGASETAEWLQIPADETQNAAARKWLKLWAALALADRLGAAREGVAQGAEDLQKTVRKSRKLKALRQQLLATIPLLAWNRARQQRIARERRMQRLNAVAIGAGVGAVALYFLDPETGSYRRMQLRNRVMGLVEKVKGTLGRSSGSAFEHEAARDISGPVMPDVTAEAGSFSPETFRSGATASSGSLASGLTGGATGASVSEESWPIGVRVLAGLAGGVLMVTGLGFQGVPGIGGRALGAGLLARALINMPFKRLARREKGTQVSTLREAEAAVSQSEAATEPAAAVAESDLLKAADDATTVRPADE
jgi:hypothetical protein